MGAEPWEYFVPYEENIENVLHKLKRQEFEAGRFNPSELKPATIEKAMEMSDADGTRSILDMESIGDEPECGVLTAVSSEELLALFGTDKPDRAAFEEMMYEIYEDIGRGQGVYAIVYKDGTPSEIFFGGYSYD